MNLVRSYGTSIRPSIECDSFDGRNPVMIPVEIYENPNCKKQDIPNCKKTGDCKKYLLHSISY